MKNTLFIYAIISILFASCSKQGSNTTAIPTAKSYNCHCAWKPNPIKDTSCDYGYRGDTITLSQVQADCKSKDQKVKSISGSASGAACSLD